MCFGGGVALQLRLFADKGSGGYLTAWPIPANYPAMIEDRTLPSRPPRVVAIDGDPLTRRMLHQLFANRGYCFATAAEGRSASELCARLSPDVLLLGHVEPPGSDWELLEQLQRKNPRVPVILIARPGTILSPHEVQRRGVFGCLTQPLDLARLDEQVALAIESHERVALAATTPTNPTVQPESVASPPEPVTNWQAFVAARIAAGSQELHAEGFEVMERQVMSRVLAHTAGNQARAARILGITRGHLRKKIRTLGIPLPGLHRETRLASDQMPPRPASEAKRPDQNSDVPGEMAVRR
jgi:DNA-binding NtrC family response regulator